MKIKKTYRSILRRDEYIYDVVGIYWNSEKTHFLYLDPRDYSLSVYYSDEVEVIDPVINFKMMFFQGKGSNMPGFFHWALIEKKLLDEVIDNRGNAREEFLSIIRAENLIDW